MGFLLKIKLLVKRIILPLPTIKEGYVFNIRNTLNDENVGGKLDPADKEAITKIVDETIAWMDSNYEVLEKDVYDAKQKEVEAVVNPIMTKLYQQAGAGAGGMPGGMPGVLILLNLLELVLVELLPRANLKLMT